MQYNYAGKMKYLSCKNSDILYCKHLSCRVQCALFLSGAFAHQPYKGRLGGNVSYILCTLRPCHFQGFCMGDTLLVSLSFSCFTVGQSTIFHNRIFRIVHRKLHHFLYSFIPRGLHLGRLFESDTRAYRSIRYMLVASTSFLDYRHTSFSSN